MSHTTQSPAYAAAHLTGQRESFAEHLGNGDRGHWPSQHDDRAQTYLTPAGFIDWTRTDLRGDVSAWDEAEAHLGGAA